MLCGTVPCKCREFDRAAPSRTSGVGEGDLATEGRNIKLLGAERPEDSALERKGGGYTKSMGRAERKNRTVVKPQILCVRRILIDVVMLPDAVSLIVDYLIAVENGNIIAYGLLAHSY